MIGIEEKQKGKVLTTRQKALFVKYYPVIDKIVNSMKTKLPAYADYDELHSAGVTGACRRDLQTRSVALR